MRLVVLALLVVGAVACVPNGYGEEGDGGCALVYCNKGHEPDDDHTRCVPCEKGKYSDTQDLSQCSVCQNMPKHSEPKYYGEESASCAFTCHPNTYGQACQTLSVIAQPIIYVAMCLCVLWFLAYRLRLGKKQR